ncbi:hypothetical protein FRC98_16300 [Lujinxingia vulgaris]|uniref:Lipoprotein n=1 Tax=Lujinxingia vulgaris TaxID=2600176 RepID=A0A5C6X2J4_9DELT|nr:hypothetical protein [Lujinxingia vulgaris]TXD35376.1 hypothetical protein FRC98_16300 [Lujinxingia vulgaris]
MPLPHAGSLTAFVSLVALALLVGCEGAPADGTDQTIRELEARASKRAPQIEVSMGYLHHHGQDWPEGEVRIEGPDGQEAVLTRLLVVTSAVELHLCAPTNTLGATLYDLLLPTAHAHVPSSATRQGTPYVEDLLGPARATRMVGGIAPPPGDYCEMHVLLTPADDDIINLTGVPTSELDGLTALVDGRWRPSPEEPWQEFRWTHRGVHIARTPLLNPKDGSAPLALNAPDDTALLLIDKSLSLTNLQNTRWSADGPDFTPVMHELPDRIELYRFDRPPSP